MKKEDFLRYVGSMQQLAYARRIRYDEGRAGGMQAVEVRSGPLRFVVMLDKCLDICELTWRGEQMNFLSKPGLIGRNPYDTHGQEAQRSIMGGLFFTCGYENICAPCPNPNGAEYPMHGRLRTSPAEHVGVEAQWEGDDYVLRVRGEVREAELFGENMVLRRTIETRLGKPEIRVTDEIRNESFRPEPMMLMYHCNVGYPFLTEDSKLILPTLEVTPRDEISRAHEKDYGRMEPPRDNEAEYVYLHRLGADAQENSFAAVVSGERALEISFNRRELPYFGQWKSTGSGDYVMGLEPGNAAVYGRLYHEKRGDLPMLAPQASTRVRLSFRILEGEQVNGLYRRAEALCEQK